MDEDDTIFDYPHEVLKAALAWVPREYLYHGVTEMVDHLVVDTEEEDEPADTLSLLGVLFEASVMGRCFHKKEDDEEDHSPPPITETEIQDFISKLGLDKDE